MMKRCRGSQLNMFLQEHISKLFLYSKKSINQRGQLINVTPATLLKSISVICNFLELKKEFPVQELPLRGCFSSLQVIHIRFCRRRDFSFVIIATRTQIQLLRTPIDKFFVAQQIKGKLKTRSANAVTLLHSSY